MSDSFSSAVSVLLWFAWSNLISSSPVDEGKWFFNTIELSTKGVEIYSFTEWTKKYLGTFVNLNTSERKEQSLLPLPYRHLVCIG